MAKWGLWVGTCALAAACSSLPDIPRGTCGNHVLESGEDCDTSKVGDDHTVCRAPGQVGACRFDCAQDPAGNPIPCPAGWSCGADAICRAAKGEYVALSGTIASDAITLAVGDFNGDRVLDLSETSAIDTRVRFGGASSDFTQLFRIPMNDAHPAIGDVSADGLADLAFSLDGSLAVWRGARNNTLQPTLYPSFPIPASDITFTLANALVRHTGEEIVLFTPVPKVPDMLAVSVRDTTDQINSDDKQGNYTIAVYPKRHASDLAALRVAQIDERPDSKCDELVFAFKGDTRVHIVTTCIGDRVNRLGPNGQPTKAIDDVLLPPGSVVGTSFHVTDLDNDGHLDLLVDAPLNGERHFSSYLGKGDGTFGVEIEVTAYFIARNPEFPLAVGQITKGDNQPDFVVSDGIEMRPLPPGPSPTVLFRIAPPNGIEWTDAAILDLNGNGLLDVVCGGRREVDFYNGTGTPLVNLFAFPIDGSASAFRFGDFDGDLALDIAYKEHDDGAGVDGVSVLFGRIFNAPIAPVTLGQPGFIQTINAGVLSQAATSAPTGMASIGLFVKSPDSNGSFISILSGTSTRQLQSPFGLARSSGDPQNGPNAFIRGFGFGLAAGQFTDHPDKHPDLAAVGVEPPAAIRMWLAPSSGAAQLDAATTTASDPALDSVNGLGASPTTHLAWHLAQSIAVDLDASPSGGVEEMLTLVPPASESHVKGSLFVTKAQNGKFQVDPSKRVDVGVDAIGPEWTLRRADVDADGAVDVIVVAMADAAHAKVHVFFNARNGALGAPVTIDAPAGTKLLAAATLNADSDPLLEIALLTDKGVFLAQAGAAAGAPFTVAQRPLANVEATGGRAIVAGDLNGDGIDDLAIASAGVLQVFQGLPVTK